MSLSPIRIQCKYLINSAWVCFLLGLTPVSALEWNTIKISDQLSEAGNYAIDNNRYVFEGYDGNDWEIYYHRPNDIIPAVRYGLKIQCGNGNSHQEGGITKVGGRKRVPCVSFDYEVLCYFDISSYSGTLKRAKLIIFFENCDKEESSNPKNIAINQLKESEKSTKCTPKIVVYNENKGAWNPQTVSYNTFNHCPWNENIGEISIPDQQVNRVFLKNKKLKNLAQSWIDDPDCNNGLVLTSDLNSNCAYFRIRKVILVLTFENKIMQLTNNDIDDYDPQISRINITWGAFDGNDSEIFFWNGISTTQVTNNDIDEFSPQISGKKIVFEGYDGNDNEIYYWNGGTIKNLTDNDVDEYEAKINNGKITWYGFDGNDDEIFFSNGNRVWQITNNDYDDRSPDIFQSKVVWKGYDGNDDEIYFWKKQEGIIHQITSTDFHESYPKIFQNKIVWSYHDNNDYEISYWDGTNIVNITNNDFNDDQAEIGVNGVTYTSYEDGDFDIYYYNNGIKEKVHNNNDNDYSPLISKNNIIWSTEEFNPDYGYNIHHIYIAHGTEPGKGDDEKIEEEDKDIEQIINECFVKPIDNPKNFNNLGMGNVKCKK